MPVFEGEKYVVDDNKRPALPYLAGACFEIKRHMRLTPFDNGTCYQFPEVSSLSDPLLPSEILPPGEILKPRDNLTPWSWSESENTNPSKVPPRTVTERVLRHRPRKTKPHDEDKTTRRLELVRQIRVRDGAYAQVVQCRVEGIRGPLVTKIFDPLYRWEDVALDEPQSPVGLTESEWSREAAAYARIQDRGLDGRYTPRFEGCWSFDIPYELELEMASSSAADNTIAATTTTHISGRHSGRRGRKRRRGSSEEPARRTFKLTRNVRLLLMEYIPGDSILHLLETGAYQKIHPSVRMDLLGRVGEAQSALWHIRVSQGDSHSRNVVIGVKKEDHNSSSSSSSHAGKSEDGARNGRELREQGEQDVQEWRVVLIDFGQSVVLDLPNAVINLKGRLPPALPLPPNPMTRCRGSWPIRRLRLGADTDDAAPEGVANWIDKAYDTFETRRKWMEARWGKGSASAHRYQPVEYDKLHERL
ncbi:hypothetical protein Daus18300_006673 [Diaporthe australafricana]|uniref:Protein kinase domain-containing protein n=1 Tax=Diaporthe australafricana TaxID=127596 RepID=A0ABR3WTE1_9PEZI